MATIMKEDSALGATIKEIDLREPLDESLTGHIAKASAENEVIFFRLVLTISARFISR